VRGRDEVALAVRPPADEAGPEPRVGLDGEDAAQDAPCERRDAAVPPLDPLLGGIDLAGELLASLIETRLCGAKVGA